MHQYLRELRNLLNAPNPTIYWGKFLSLHYFVLRSILFASLSRSDILRLSFASKKADPQHLFSEMSVRFGPFNSFPLSFVNSCLYRVLEFPHEL